MQEHQRLFPQHNKYCVAKFHRFAQCEQPTPEAGYIPQPAYPRIVIDAKAVYNAICETRMPEFGQHPHEAKYTEASQQQIPSD